MRTITASLFLCVLGFPLFAEPADTAWSGFSAAEMSAGFPVSIITENPSDPSPAAPREPEYRSDKEPLQTHTIIAPYDGSTRLGSGTGAYQLSFYALEKMGYIAPNQKHPGFGPGDWGRVIWTGKDGIRSRNQLMLSHQVQDVIFGDLLSMKNGS